MTGQQSGVQLALGIGLKDNATFANFLPGPNAQLLYALAQGAEPFIYLWGTAGSGKSHLLQAACHQVSESGGGAVYLPMAELSAMSCEILEGLEHMPLVCVDDIERIVGMQGWETGLFHLYNRIRDARGRLIVTAESAPPALGLALPDLASRLAWGLVFQVLPLTDGDKIAALRLRAAKRGMELSDEVAAYLLKRSPRDTHALFELLDHLDKASLAAQRRLTIPFVREILQQRG